MISQIKDKKVIFFDVGYTLDRPASGDWLFTNMFLELAGKRLKLHSDEKIRDAREAGIRFLNQDHLFDPGTQVCDLLVEIGPLL